MDQVLQDFGFTLDFTAGSHVTYRHESGERITVAAHGNTVPAYIVKQALKAIDNIHSEDASDETESDEG